MVVENVEGFQLGEHAANSTRAGSPKARRCFSSGTPRRITRGQPPAMQVVASASASPSTYDPDRRPTPLTHESVNPPRCRSPPRVIAARFGRASCQALRSDSAAFCSLFRGKKAKQKIGPKRAGGRRGSRGEPRVRLQTPISPRAGG